jgi:hypothetical protein
VAEQGELLLDGGEAATPVEAPEAKEEAL